MKIAFSVVKNILRGGGVEKYTEELGSRLVDLGHEVLVYSMNNYGVRLPAVKGMKIHYVPCIPVRQMEKLSASQLAGVRLAFSNWPDIVHYHSVSPGSTAWMARKTGKNVVIQMHGLEWKRARWGKSGAILHRFLEKISLLGRPNLTAVSKVQCDYFKEKYRLEAKYIPCGVSVKGFSRPEQIKQMNLKPQKFILFASRLVRDKGAHYLIPAFRKLETDFSLVIAGDVPNESRYKMELLKLAGDDERIIFPGFVEGRLLGELFSNAGLYVQPSEIEGLSIALLEAMSYGLPCLVSDIPENMEAVGDCGITFKNKDVDDLSQKMAYIIGNLNLKKTLAECSIRRVKNFYDWDAIAAQFVSYYEGIVQRQSAKKFSPA